MTFTKTGAEFPADAFSVELSDAAYRTHHEAISYLFTIERTDCLVRTDEVRRFTGSPHADLAVKELVDLGWWRVKQQGYEVVHHGEVIRGGIVAQQKKRDRDRRSQQAWRKRQEPPDVSADVSDDISAYPDRQTNRHLGDDEFPRRNNDPRFWKTASEMNNTEPATHDGQARRGESR